MKALLWLSLLLILLSLTVHTRHIAAAGLTTADDIRAELKTHEILRDGWKVYWQDAARLAAGEGRFYYYATLGLFFLPYVFPDGLLRAAVIVAVQFGTLLAVALYLRRYLSSRTFWLLLALLCALLPLWLQPGDNRVHVKSFAQRMEARGDARYIVFGLQNWALVRYDEAPAR